MCRAEELQTILAVSRLYVGFLLAVFCRHGNMANEGGSGRYVVHRFPNAHPLRPTVHYLWDHRACFDCLYRVAYQSRMERPNDYRVPGEDQVFDTIEEDDEEVPVYE